jgi:hypothetical protein
MYVGLHQHRCEKNLVFIDIVKPNGGIAFGEDLKRTTEETAEVLLEKLLPQHSFWQNNKILIHLC